MYHKKKSYSKPEVKKTIIDNEITMVMLSDGFGPGSGDDGLDNIMFGKLSPRKWFR